MPDDRCPRIGRGVRLTFDRDGAERIRAMQPALLDLERLEAVLFRIFSPDQAGIRLHGQTGLTPFLVNCGVIGSCLERRLPASPGNFVR